MSTPKVAAAKAKVAAGGGAASEEEQAIAAAVRATEKERAAAAAAEKARLKSEIAKLEASIPILIAEYEELDGKRQEAFINHAAAQAAVNLAVRATEKERAAADETRHKLLAITDAAARANVKLLTAVKTVAWIKFLIRSSELDLAITDATSAARLLDEAAEEAAKKFAAEEAAKKFAAEKFAAEERAAEEAAEEAAAEEALRTAGLLY
jgi:hypothetical protein